MNEKKDSKKTKAPVSKKTTSKKPPLTKEEQLKRKLKKAENEIVGIKDQLLRTAAELDNYRKRTERDFTRIAENAQGEIIRDILPIIDDLERSLKTTSKKDDKHFIEGIELIFQKLLSSLKARGLEPIDAVGKPFDVNCHDALLLMEKKGKAPGIVLEQHEKGYVWKGRVLRHAKVVVSK